MAEIERLSVDQCVTTGGKYERLIISLKGVNGHDLVACMDDDLLQEVIKAAGPDICMDVHDLTDRV